MRDKIGNNPSSIRIHNRKKVLDILRNTESDSVTHIAKEVHLSKTTICKIIDHLQQEKMIVNIGKDQTMEDRGKRPELYSFNKDFGYVISITIHSGYIVSALFDARGTVFYKEKISILKNAPLEEVIEILANFISQWQNPGEIQIKRGSKLLGIVVGSHGVTDTEKGVCFAAAKFNSWPANAPIKDLIEQKVSLKAPFYIDNYNRYYVLADKYFGNLIEYENIVDIVTTGGVGSGIIIDDKILRGNKFLSGEIGHMSINPDYPEYCSCGGRGCFDQMVSQDRLLKMAKTDMENHRDSRIYHQNPADLTDLEIFEATNAGDSWARELMDDIIKWFAIGVQNIVLMFNPEIIIISGQYSKAGPYFLENLKEKVEQVSLTKMEKKTEIRYSSLSNEEGPLLGGAFFALQDYFMNDNNY